MVVGKLKENIFYLLMRMTGFKVMSYNMFMTLLKRMN